MKQLCTALLLILSLQSFGQDFAPLGATWHYSEFFFMPLDYQESYIKFEVTGDTLIDGKNCSIIQKEGKVVCYNRPDVEYVYSSNDSVYVYDPHFLDFRLLYDFNANAGDSWEMVVFGGDSATDVDTNVVFVDSTDFIQVNGQDLKRLFVTYSFDNEGFATSYTSTIIERFGDMHYLFNYFADFLQVCDMNSSGGLRCYEDSILGFYESGIADSCEYQEPYVGLSENDLDGFSISPNPASDALNIIVSSGQLTEVVLQDMNGRIVLRSTDLQISLANLQSGMYLVSVKKDGTWFQQRCIKQ